MTAALAFKQYDLFEVPAPKVKYSQRTKAISAQISLPVEWHAILREMAGLVDITVQVAIHEAITLLLEEPVEKLHTPHHSKLGRTIIVYTRIPRALTADLDAIAAAHGCYRTRILREAVWHWIYDES